MYHVKPSVRIENLDPILKLRFEDIEQVFHDHDSLFTITSGHEGDPSDGVHMKTSHHYWQNRPNKTGGAIDVRARHLNEGTILSIAVRLQAVLGPTFDVVAEIVDKMGNPRNHIHIELHA